MFDETGMAKDRRRSRFRRLTRIGLLVLGPLVVLLGAGYFYVTGGRYVSTDDAFVKADKTTISTDVAGRVVQVNVAENQVVKVDQPLFKLDDEPYRLAEHLMNEGIRLLAAKVGGSADLYDTLFVK